MKEMLTMKCQQSQKYYGKTAQQLLALREGDEVRVKPNPGSKTSKWRRGQIISKLGDRSSLVDVNGRGYQMEEESEILTCYIRTTKH